MWEGLVRAPRGRISPRKFMMFFATTLVACFAYGILFSQTTHAADAVWGGDNLSYDARDYTGPQTATEDDKSGLPKDTIYFATYEDADQRNGQPARGYIIYFEPGTDVSQATSAYLVTAEFDVATGVFSNLSPPETISIDASTYGNAETVEPSSCDVSGIGWMICPTSRWIAEGMDYIYNIVASYLNVSPILGGDSGLYEVWNIVRNIANICFIIGFLILIYAQVTGGTISNYSIKKILPRIIIAAILVNISYWICALAVDISNILGRATQDMFMAMQERLGGANSDADDIGWAKVTALALGGGSLATIGLLGATAGGAGALVFLIIGALIPALFAVFVAMIILAGRQALITVLIVLSPLAFVAYLLPNTEEWFGRWRKLFTALMVMFPAFAVIFGGAQMTGVLIIQNANTLPVVILGLLVQVIPLFVTPFLIKLSSGLMGTIAGLANDRSKGVFDRTQNWAKANQEAHKARALSKGMERRKNLSFDKGKKLRSAYNAMTPTALGAYAASGKMHRDKMTAAHNAHAEGSYNSTRRGRQLFDAEKSGELNKSLAHAQNEERWQGSVAGDISSTRRTQRGRNRENAQFDTYRHMTHQAHSAEGRAELYKSKTQAEGEREFRAEVEASNALKRVVKDTHHAKQAAAEYETIVQKAAEKSWNDRVRSDQATREVHLKKIRYEDGAKLAEEKVTTLVENIRAEGSQVSGITVAEQQLAQQIKQAHQDISIQSDATGSAKIVQQSNLAKSLQGEIKLRKQAAGVDPHGEVRVLAAAKKAVSDELIKATNNFYDTMDYDIASNPEKLEAKWRDAVKREEMSEVIAYGRKLAVNAPGIRRLTNLLTEYTADKDPLNDNVMLLKEILGSDSTFRSASRTFEVWANNETVEDTDANGNKILRPYKNFGEVRNAPAPFANITAARFANQNALSQEETLYWLQNNAPEKLGGFLDAIGDKDGHLWKDLKGSVSGAIIEYRKNGTRFKDPYAT